MLVLMIESCAGIEAAVSKDFKETVVGDGNGSENSGERSSRKIGAKQRKIGTVIWLSAHLMPLICKPHHGVLISND